MISLPEKYTIYSGQAQAVVVLLAGELSAGEAMVEVVEAVVEVFTVVEVVTMVEVVNVAIRRRQAGRSREEGIAPLTGDLASGVIGHAIYKGR